MNEQFQRWVDPWQFSNYLPRTCIWYEEKNHVAHSEIGIAKFKPNLWTQVYMRIYNRWSAEVIIQGYNSAANNRGSKWNIKYFMFITCFCCYNATRPCNLHKDVISEAIFLENNRTRDSHFWIGTSMSRNCESRLPYNWHDAPRDPWTRDVIHLAGSWRDMHNHFIDLHTDRVRLLYKLRETFGAADGKYYNAQSSVFVA